MHNLTDRLVCRNRFFDQYPNQSEALRNPDTYRLRSARAEVRRIAREFDQPGLRLYSTWLAGQAMRIGLVHMRVQDDVMACESCSAWSFHHRLVGNVDGDLV